MPCTVWPQAKPPGHADSHSQTEQSQRPAPRARHGHHRPPTGAGQHCAPSGGIYFIRDTDTALQAHLVQVYLMQNRLKKKMFPSFYEEKNKSLTITLNLQPLQPR